jgi:hypothetical protein
MIFCLCYFSCYNMVANFIVKIMSLMPMLEYFDLSTQCFTSFDQDCIGACHLKIIVLLSLTYSRMSRS